MRISILLVLTTYTVAELPTELDPFLEKLFETEECDDFITSSDFTSVATTKCDPFTCDFPRQVCARPAAKYQDRSSNFCRSIPQECITAANGGMPVGPAKPQTTTPPAPVPRMGPAMGPNGSGSMGPRPMLVTIAPSPMSICQMDPPTGRFCGFRPMFTYNKETFQCDEFWFPGCRTAETNANLFDDYQQCQKIAEMCKPTPPPAPPPQPLQVRPHNGGGGWHTGRELPPPSPPPLQPNPQPNQGQGGSPIIEAFNAFGGNKGGNSPIGQGALGAIGMFTGSGLTSPTGQGPFGSFVPQTQGPQQPQPAAAGGGNEQDLGLFGLIQQGIMGAQAIKGGQGGKEAAAETAGKILQQFTGFDLNGFGGGGGGLGNLFNGK